MTRSFAPQSRYRMYTTARSYLAALDRRSGTDWLERLESTLSGSLGVRDAICVPQNRVGLYLTLHALIQPGQDVIMSPYTIVDVSNMVLSAGGRPLYADVERETCNISADEVEKLITPDTGAVLVTHLHGLAADVERIRDLCAQHGVPMVEDCAQAFGVRVGGKPVGSFGRAGVFSFGMHKNVNTWSGGVVAIDDSDAAQRIRGELEGFRGSSRPLMTQRARSGLAIDLATSPAVFKALTFWVFRFGFLHDIDWINDKVRVELDASRKSELPESYRTRFTPAQARLALAQLEHVEANGRERVKRGLMYHEGLRDVPELIIPPARDDMSHTYTYFPIQYHDRDALLKYMMRHRRDVAAQHYRNNADVPAFAEFHRDCPNARAVARELIFLPTYPRYALDEVQRTIRVIRDFFGRDAA
jgi:perosamine synthetase